MGKFNKLECSISEYDQIQKVQMMNNSVLQEQYHGSRRKLFANDRIIATMSLSADLKLGGIDKSRFNSFLGLFNKQLYKQFENNPSLLELNIDFDGLSRGKNNQAWDAMPDGDIFYNVDLKSAYWQIAHKLGYLNTKMYSAYINDDDFKMAKRLCISFLARRNFMLYYLPDGSTYKIDCDTTALKQVYQNIRNDLYATIQSNLEQGIEWLEYNIDGITTRTDLEKVCNHFDKAGLLYKVTACTKLNGSEYLYGEKPRNFILKHRQNHYEGISK